MPKRFKKKYMNFVDDLLIFIFFFILLLIYVPIFFLKK